MTRTRITIAGFALLTAACGGTVGGDAKPGTTTDTPTSTPSSSASDAPLAAVKPCDLISNTDATSLSLGSPAPRRAVGSETCEWRGTGPDRGGVTVSVNPKTGAEDLNLKGDDKTPSKFGKYDGFIATPQQANGLCTAVISVSDSSSVHVIANADVANRNTPKACALVKKATEFVAAKLP